MQIAYSQSGIVPSKRGPRANSCSSLNSVLVSGHCSIWMEISAHSKANDALQKVSIRQYLANTAEHHCQLKMPCRIDACLVPLNVDTRECFEGCVAHLS